MTASSDHQAGGGGSAAHRRRFTDGMIRLDGEGGVVLTSSGFLKLAAIAGAVWGLWGPIKSTTRLAELPDAFAALTAKVEEGNAQLRQAVAEQRATARDVELLQQLAPRVQELERQAAVSVAERRVLTQEVEALRRENLTKK